MALITWDDSFSVSVIELDRQHQKLVSMINELHEAMGQGKGKDALGMIIKRLVDYTVVHFKAEETCFDKFGYPEKDSHKKEHIDFVKKVSDFKEGFEKGKLGLSLEVMHFLCNWLQNHIKKTDKKYSQFFNEKGLK